MNKWSSHDYQRTGLSFLLANPCSGLFLDPGLGKTSISLAAIKILKYAREIKGVLLVAPLRVTYSVWPGEIEKWVNFNGLTCTILHDDNKESLWGEKKDIYLINPEGLPWLHSELLAGLKAGKASPFNALWIDESTKFKSHDSKRFDLLVDMLPLFKRRHIMTGTPSPRNLLDLWSQMYLLDEGKTLGNNFYKFRKKYFESHDWDKYSWEIKDFAAEEIHQLVAPMVLEMSSADHLDMPECVYNDIVIPLPTKAAKYYKEMEKNFFIQIEEKEVSAEAAAQSSMKCHQIANGKVYEDVPEGLDEVQVRAFKRTRKVLHVHKAKVDALADLLSELNGKPLLIAYHFKHDLEALRGLLGKDVPFIGSGVKPERAKQLEQQWNRGELPVLLGHPDSMSHGLNFQQGGNDVCWYSLTWNLENYIQFIARVWRQGVKGKYVRVHHLIAQGTVDEAMLLRLGQRADQQLDLREAIRKYRLNLI